MTDTHVVETAGMEPGIPVGEGKKDDPAEVAQTGFDAMQKGEAEVTFAANNKIMETVEGCCSTRWWRRRTAR